MGHLCLALFTLFSVPFFCCMKCYEEKHFHVPFQRKLFIPCSLGTWWSHFKGCFDSNSIAKWTRSYKLLSDNSSSLLHLHSIIHSCFIVLKRPVFPLFKRWLGYQPYKLLFLGKVQVVYWIRKNSRLIHIYSQFATTFIFHS